MASVLPLRTKSLREQVSAEEWQTRVDLAACYRLVALYGMTDLVYNHITAEKRIDVYPYHKHEVPYEQAETRFRAIVETLRP